jgi:hypothetical protein
MKDWRAIMYINAVARGEEPWLHRSELVLWQQFIVGSLSAAKSRGLIEARRTSSRS